MASLGFLHHSKPRYIAKPLDSEQRAFNSWVVTQQSRRRLAAEYKRRVRANRKPRLAIPLKRHHK